MAVINFARREIITKVVFFGARGAGATANLRSLYIRTDGETQGPLLPFGPEGDAEHTLFFEVRHRTMELPGFSVRARVYSLPGGLDDPDHRSEICRDLDAAVFVADARPTHQEANLEALLDLDRQLKDLDLELAALPMVFQVNHADHSRARATDDVVYELNPYRHPVVTATASDGLGVVETLDKVLGELRERLEASLAGHPSDLQVHAIHRQEALSPEQVVAAHERAIGLARAERDARRESTATPPPWSRSRYDILPTGPSVRVPYQPPEMVGMRPVHVLDSRLDRGRILLDVVMDDHEGAHPTRLRIKLAPPEAFSEDPTQVGRGGAPTTPNPRRMASTAGTVPALPERDDVTASLPASIDIVRERAPTDPSPALLLYGAVGAVGGLLAGLLIGFPRLGVTRRGRSPMPRATRAAP